MHVRTVLKRQRYCSLVVAKMPVRLFACWTRCKARAVRCIVVLGNGSDQCSAVQCRRRWHSMQCRWIGEGDGSGKKKLASIGSSPSREPPLLLLCDSHSWTPSHIHPPLLFFLQSASDMALLSTPRHHARVLLGLRKWASTSAGHVVMQCRAQWTLALRHPRLRLVWEVLGRTGYSTCSKARRLLTRCASLGRTGLRSPNPFPLAAWQI